jgi:hypothetical protein
LNVLERLFDCGHLASGRVTRSKISLSWSVEAASGWNNNRTWLSMYYLAIDGVVNGMIRGDPTFQSEFCIRLLTTVFDFYSSDFPHDGLLNVVFVSPCIYSSAIISLKVYMRMNLHVLNS